MANNQILTAAQMVAAEGALIARGVSVDALMQRAGQGAAQWVWRIAAGRSVTVLCGPGNNGGDGYVIAQTLHQRGLKIRLIAPIPPRTAAARKAASLWEGETFRTANGLSGDIFVDCLFGSGLNRPLSDDHVAMIAQLAKAHEFRIAIDLPSGVETDSGELLGPVLQYQLTLALGAWKFAHWRMPAMACMGARRLVPIGVAPQPGAAEVVMRPALSEPGPGAHKYTRGLLAIIGGAMPGAALLAAEAAMRSGAGYGKLLSDHSHPAVPAGLVVDEAPLDDALSDKRIDALLVGPGLGGDEDALARLQFVLARDRPTVLDGDALVLLSPPMVANRSQPIIATPHEGELAELCANFAVPDGGKLEQARALAKASGMIIAAKGPDTILCAPEGRTALCSDSPSWLSIAGSGDCLAGITASRLAAGAAPFAAACEGAWLHGEAARIAGPAFTADELACTVGAAYAACL